MKKYKNILTGIIFMLLVLIINCPCNTAFSAVKANKDYTKTIEYKSYKDISLRYITINKLKKKALALSLQDKETIKKYVFGAVRGEDTFLLINSYQRGNLKDYIPAKEITKPLGCRLEYYSESLQKSIAKTKLPQNITLYADADDIFIQHLFKSYNAENLLQRNVDEDTADLINKKVNGMKYTEKGFLSASYDKNCITKTRYRFEIKAPKNMQAVLIEDFGEKQKKRVILNRNYKWEIMSVRKEYDKDGKTNYYNIIIRNIK